MICSAKYGENQLTPKMPVFTPTPPAPLVAGKPEERRYRLRYFIDNQAVGAWSDVIIVITLP